MAQDLLNNKIFSLGNLKGIKDGSNTPNAVVKNALIYLKDSLTGASAAYLFDANSADRSVATGNGLAQLPYTIQEILKRGGSYMVCEGLSRGIFIVGDKIIKTPDDTRYNNAIETLAGYIGEVNLTKKIGKASGKTSKARLIDDKALSAFKTKKTGGVSAIKAYAIAN